MDEAIPRELALTLCKEIREENKRKRFGFGKMQCSGCYWAARDDLSKLCIFGNEKNRGCQLVNKRYRTLYEAKQ